MHSSVKKVVDEAEIPVDIYRKAGRTPPAVEPGITGKNIPKLNVKGVMNILRKCYEQKPKGNALILGGAGIGKSEAVLQFAQSAAASEGKEFKKLSDLKDKQRFEVINDPGAYYMFLDLRASTLNPEQSTGVPDVEFGKKEGYLRFLPPDWANLITNPNFSGMIFLDEINRGNESIVNSLLQFVLDRVVAERRVSDNALIVAAANIGSEFSGTVALDPALMSRFDVGVLVADVNEWVKYASKIGVSRYIINFALSNPDKNFYGRGEEIADHNIPLNPRNLVAASRNLQWVEQKYLDKETNNTPLPETFTGNIYEDIQNVIALRVGERWVNSFIEWLQVVHAFDWAEIVDMAQKGEFKQKAKKFDQSKLWALVNYIVNEIIGRYEKARKSGDAGTKKELFGDLYNIMAGLDPDQLKLLSDVIIRDIKDNPPQGVTLDQALADYTELMTAVLELAKKNNSPLLTAIQKIAAANRVANPKYPGKEKLVGKESYSPKKLYEKIRLHGHKATPEELSALEGTHWKHKLNGTTPSSKDVYKPFSFKGYFKEESSDYLSRQQLADKVLDGIEDTFNIHFSNLQSPNVDIEKVKEHAYGIINRSNASMGDKQYIAKVVNNANDVDALNIKLGILS